MAKKKASKQKKMDTRVNFTPMVDMMMLLITFFMLCTTLSKPQAMQLTMPSNDENMSKEDKSVTKASYTITMYVSTDEKKLYYVEGLPNYSDPSCIKETTWGKEGIRSVLIGHITEDGTQPVQEVMLAKAKLDEKKLNNPKDWPDSLYNAELSKIKAGDVTGTGEKIQTMTVIIKPTDGAPYAKVVEALDEMQICSIGKYVIDDINPDDEKLLEQRGIK